jgi:hypothetical protein
MRAVLALQQTAQYKRHRPGNTLLYQLVEQYYPDFKEAIYRPCQKSKKKIKFETLYKSMLCEALNSDNKY